MLIKKNEEPVVNPAGNRRFKQWEAFYFGYYVHYVLLNKYLVDFSLQDVNNLTGASFILENWSNLLYKMIASRMNSTGFVQQII